MSDCFKVTESYDWHDDVMEITRAIVRGTDEARLVNIADHFKVDLSEIRKWVEEKKMEYDSFDELCPHCGRILRGYEGLKECFCKFCGGKILR